MLETLLDIISAEFGIDKNQLLQGSRLKQVIKAKYAMIYILHELGYTHQQTAEIVGLKNHTTSIHAVRQVESLMCISAKYSYKINQIINLIKDQNTMTIKLNHNQLNGLHVLITHLLKTIKPTNMGEKLLNELVDQINEKLRTKLRKYQNNSNVGTSIKLNSIEAKALYCWALPLMDEAEKSYTYEVIVAMNAIKQIDKQYA